MEIKAPNSSIIITDYQLVDPLDQISFKVRLKHNMYYCHNECKGTWCKISNKYRPYSCHYHFIYKNIRYYGVMINPDKDLEFSKYGNNFILKADHNIYISMIAANIVPIEANSGWGESGTCRICDINHKENCIRILYFDNNHRRDVYICKNPECFETIKRIILIKGPSCCKCIEKVTNFDNIVRNGYKDCEVLLLTCSPYCSRISFNKKGELKCHYCLKYSEESNICDTCSTKCYCSQQCKKSDWNKNHKNKCIFGEAKTDVNFGNICNVFKESNKIINKQLKHSRNLCWLYERSSKERHILNRQMLEFPAFKILGYSVFDQFPICDIPNSSFKKIIKTQVYDLIDPVTYNCYKKLFPNSDYDNKRPFPFYVNYGNIGGVQKIWKYPDENLEMNGYIVIPRIKYNQKMMGVEPKENNSHMKLSRYFNPICFMCGEEDPNFKIVSTYNTYVCSQNCFNETEIILANDGGIKCPMLTCGNVVNRKWTLYFDNDKFGIYHMSCSKKCMREHINNNTIHGVHKKNETIFYCTIPCMDKDCMFTLDDGKKGKNCSNMKRCDSCLTFTREVTYCSQCRNVKYCSQDCQKNDWKNHKKECFKENNS